jgi:hypothetical protein
MVPAISEDHPPVEVYTELPPDHPPVERYTELPLNPLPVSVTVPALPEHIVAVSSPGPELETQPTVGIILLSHLSFAN